MKVSWSWGKKSYGQPGYNEGRTGHGWGTEEGIPNCSEDSGSLPRELGAKAGTTGGDGVCGMFWNWEDHGKMLNAHGRDEGEEPGGQPVESKVIKKKKKSKELQGLFCATLARGARP